jgi:hypothetical protein
MMREGYWDEKFICGVRADGKGTIHAWIPDDVSVGGYWKTGDGTKYQKRELTNRQWAMML